MSASPLEHRSRQGLLGRPAAWRLQGSALAMTISNGSTQTVALRDIREVRIYMVRSRFWEHYVCELRLADRRMLRIYDEYTRFLVWRMSSGKTYRRLVTELCAALAATDMRCRFRTGPRLSSCLLIALAMALAMYLIAQAMVSHAGMSQADGRWLFAIGCGLILLKSPYWRSANRLIEFDPVAIPEGLLPRVHQ
jgi:hypothetical protein